MVKGTEGFLTDSGSAGESNDGDFGKHDDELVLS